MFVIAGLGNPGRKYDATRHNVGFDVIDKLARDFSIPVKKLKHKAYTGLGTIAGQKVMLLKPQTFMNLSGQSVQDALGFHKVTPENLIVVYDDVSLPPGKIRVRERGSSGGHNGMENILYLLGTDEFLRVRVGIGEKPNGWDLADYVLGKFAKNEIEDVLIGIADAADAVCDIIQHGAGFAMNKYNKKS